MQTGALIWSQLIDSDKMVTDGEQTLPTSHWVGAYNRVYGFQGLADILRRSSRLSVELKSHLLRRLRVSQLRKGSRETLEEFSVGRGNLVINLV